MLAFKEQNDVVMRQLVALTLKMQRKTMARLEETHFLEYNIMRREATPRKNTIPNFPN